MAQATSSGFLYYANGKVFFVQNTNDNPVRLVSQIVELELAGEPMLNYGDDLGSPTFKFGIVSE